MAWIDAAELKARFGKAKINDLADLDHDGNPDSGVIATAIADGQSRAESILRGRFTASELSAIDTTVLAPDKAKRIGASLALWYLSSQRYDTVSDDVLRLRDDAIQECRDIVRYGDSLGITPATTTDSAAARTVTRSRSDDTDDSDLDPMTLSNMANW